MQPDARPCADVPLPDRSQPQPVPEFRQVQLLLAQMVLVPCSTAALVFLPLPWNVGLMAIAYCVLIVDEHRSGIINPTSFALAGISLFALLVASTTSVWLDMPILVLLYNSALLSAGIFQLMRGRHTAFGLGGTLGSSELQKKTAQLWTVIPALAMILVLLHLSLVSAQMTASPLLLMLLLAFLPLGGALLTVWMHFVASVDTRSGFTVDDCRFERLPRGETDLRPFYRHFIREALPTIRQGIAPDQENLDAWVQLKMDLDRESWSRTEFYVARHQGDIVGTIACTLRLPGAALGFEQGHSKPLSVLPLLPFGGVMEVGRLSVSGPHRFGRTVLQGLLRCAVERALAADAGFLVAQSFLSTMPIYRKMGFFVIDERVSHQTGLGAAIIPMAFNLAARVVSATDEHSRAAGLHVAPMLAERYFKRQAARSLFSRTPPWTLSDADVCAILQSTQTDTPSAQELLHGH